MSELGGIRLSTGTLRSATVEKTKNGKDYKVSFQKVTRADTALDQLPEPASVVVNDYSKQKDPLTLQAEELVRHFHKVFHKVDAHAPQSKETAQALSLISQHGFKEARHVIEFARAEAEKTNFQIQQFGAVLSYTSRALSDLIRAAAQETNQKCPPRPLSGSPGRQYAFFRCPRWLLLRERLLPTLPGAPSATVAATAPGRFAHPPAHALPRSHSSPNPARLNHPKRGTFP